MAKTDYSPEIKSAMSKDEAADKRRGIKPGSPQDQALDRRAKLPPEPDDMPMPPHNMPMNMSGGPPSAPPHAQLAAGIAHAILAHGSRGQ
jgi:hypothetical protein